MPFLLLEKYYFNEYEILISVFISILPNKRNCDFDQILQQAADADNCLYSSKAQKA